jgi:UDP-4-amino-4-deoxy-L-arabinose formyltransferase/UDP-glucuronic acid dehydrogenase (UDP-4-keto-hexauronic acid decarboxylating)
LLIGDRQPARAVAERIVAVPEGRLAGILTESGPGSALGRYAKALGIPCLDASIVAEPDAAERIAALAADWLISINNIHRLPAAVLTLFPGRALNCHPGLLPDYAGLHTHQWAIRNGEAEFGVTVHRLEPALDTGAIVAQCRFPIAETDTGLSLLTRCLATSAALLGDVLDRALGGATLSEIPQDLARRRLYRHRDALNGRIDWRLPARAVVDFVRAGNYEPFASPSYVAEFRSVSGETITVLRARAEDGPPASPGTVFGLSPEGPLVACGDGAVRLLRARRGEQIVSETQWTSCLPAMPA